MSGAFGGVCACCDVLALEPRRQHPWLCEACLDHVSDEYGKGYVLPGCPVYSAYACCEPYPWEVAA